MAGRLILPGAANRPKDALTIYVPRGAERERGDVVMVGLCRVCGTRFFKGEESAWQRHVGRCARENIEDLRASSPSELMPIFNEENWDPEVERYLRLVVGPRMVKEGRSEVLPSERAGF